MAASAASHARARSASTPSSAAKRAACLMPLVYHAASVLGVLRVFPAALNPAVAPLPAAATVPAWDGKDAAPAAAAAEEFSLEDLGL
jgi:hypothetical protein